MNRVVEQLLDRAAKAEATEEERTLAAVFEANARRIRLADGLYREIHEVLNTTLRLLPSALGRLSAMAANYSIDRSRDYWEFGAPETGSGAVECEWSNGKTGIASHHHYTDGTSAWVPQDIRTREGEEPYRTMRVVRWRWAGPAVPPPDGSVRIWKWWEAPGELRNLSDHGGDEDWVCLIPKEMAHDYLPFADALGICRVSEHFLTDGRKVLIGAHA